jgi:hypothetical protein
MKTIYFLLFITLNALANNTVKENSEIVNSNAKTVHVCDTISDPKAEKNTITGLKIVTCDSQRFGKHIYIVSDLYVEKKISFYNTAGEKVYSTSTIGSPIYLSEIQKGIYKVEITEGEKIEIKSFEVK